MFRLFKHSNPKTIYSPNAGQRREGVTMAKRHHEDSDYNEDYFPSRRQLNPAVDEQSEERKIINDLIKQIDITYASATNAKIINNAVRVEQGEYVVLPRTRPMSPPIGTHHVNPCIIICVTSLNYYGMAHFDSYRTVKSIMNFFSKFKTDEIQSIKILGGKTGQDPLRTGAENKASVLTFINTHFPGTTVHEIPPPNVGFLNCVLYENGEVVSNQFTTGVKTYNGTEVYSRLVHNIGGIILAVQSRTQNFIPLNLSEASYGEEKPLLLDRLALKALEQYEPGTPEDDMKSWVIDSSGTMLTRESRLAFGYITEQVKIQKNIIQNKLKDAESIDHANIQHLVAITPVYVGRGAEDVNIMTADSIITLCAGNNNCISDALTFFNEASPYPLIKEIIPIVAEAYLIKSEDLADQLHAKYGKNFENMAYGIDILTSDLVFCVKKIMTNILPAFQAMQMLKLYDKQSNETENTQTLVSRFCETYHIDTNQTLSEIVYIYNMEVQNKNNIEQIINLLDEKNELTKLNAIQVIETLYGNPIRRLAMKKFTGIWEVARVPKEAIESILLLFKPNLNEDLDPIQMYNELSFSIYASYFKPIQVEDLKSMPFDSSLPGAVGAIASIINNSIIQVMKSNDNFLKDFNEDEINTITMTKLIRDKIPYKHRENLLENKSHSLYTLRTDVSMAL